MNISFISLAIIVCSFVIHPLNAGDTQGLKLRIGNPLKTGVLFAVSTPENPQVITTVQFIPPKGDRYFQGSLDVTIKDPTQILALYVTSLTETASPEQINNSIINAVTAFAEGKFTRWRIKQVRPGQTKVYVNLKLVGNTPTFETRIVVQSGGLPEIVFEPF